MEDMPYPLLESYDHINVLVVDGGARGQAFKWSLEKSERIGRVYVEPFDVNQEPHRVVANLAQFATERNIDLVLPGQEDALGAGVVDIMRLNGIAAVGATAEEARLETDKTYMKQIAAQYGIPTASYEVFRNRNAAHEYVDVIGDKMVVKDAHPAQGKASIPCRTNTDAHQAVDDMFDKKRSNRGESVIIEEYLEERERTGHFSISNGVYEIWIPSEDHKQVLAGDKGPMGGGSGALAPLDWIDEDQTWQQDNQVAKAIQNLYPELKGFVYPGWKGKCLELNMRPGSPEMETYTRLINSDFLEHLIAIANGHLQTAPLEWREEYAISVVGAAVGYPDSDKIVRGERITGLERASQVDSVVIFLGSVALEDNEVYSNGGATL